MEYAIALALCLTCAFGPWIVSYALRWADRPRSIKRPYRHHRIGGGR